MEQGNGNGNNRGEVVIDRHYIDEIKTYEISEDQLGNIESGSVGSAALNFCVALYSVFLSFVVSLLTTKIESVATLVFFWVVTLTTFVLGTFFLIMWLRAHQSSRSIFVKIRAQKSTRKLRENASSEIPVTDEEAEQSDIS